MLVYYQLQQITTCQREATAGEEEDEDWWNDFYQFIEEGTRKPQMPSGP